MAEIKRKGARRRADVPRHILQKLNRGDIEAITLAEVLSVDLSQLLKNAFPDISRHRHLQMKKAQDENMGWLGRTALAGEILYGEFGTQALKTAIRHPSDQVRGWGAALVRHAQNLSFEKRLKMIEPLADDANPGVREVAWIMMRPALMEDVNTAIKVLMPWTHNDSPNIRRFASEITRPRGVWCAHIPELRKNPQPALKILRTLKADPSRYVQNSVGNWLNDASKDNPKWVTDLCKEWSRGIAPKETLYICRRALRTLHKKK